MMKEKNICLCLAEQEKQFLAYEYVLWEQFLVDDVVYCVLMQMPLDTEEQIQGWVNAIMDAMVTHNASCIAGAWPLQVIPHILKLGLDFPVFGIIPRKGNVPCRIINLGKNPTLSVNYVIVALRHVFVYMDRHYNYLFTEDMRGTVHMMYGWSDLEMSDDNKPNGIKVFIEAVTTDGKHGYVDVAISSFNSGIIGRITPDDLKGFISDDKELMEETRYWYGWLNDLVKDCCQYYMDEHKEE